MYIYTYVHTHTHCMDAHIHNAHAHIQYWHWKSFIPSSVLFHMLTLHWPILCTDTWHTGRKSFGGIFSHLHCNTMNFDCRVTSMPLPDAVTDPDWQWMPTWLHSNWMETSRCRDEGKPLATFLYSWKNISHFSFHHQDAEIVHHCSVTKINLVVAVTEKNQMLSCTRPLMAFVLSLIQEAVLMKCRSSMATH